MARHMKLLALAMAVAVGLSSSPLEAEIRDSTRDGFSLENSVDVPVDTTTAWAALVDDVDRWWPKDHSWWGRESTLSIDARAAGCFCEIDGKRQALHMLVTHVEPGTLLRMTGGLGPLQGMGLHGVLEWRLAAQPGGGTRITMAYRAGGYTPDDLARFAPVVDRVQALQLGGLRDYLGKAKPGVSTPEVRPPR